MKQIYMWLLVLLLYSINVNAQNFFNGSFENTTSTGCDYNNSNADFNGKMSNVFSFGNTPEVDIKRLNCYADIIPDGDIVLGLSRNDAIAIELSSPLIAGQSYEMNFRAYGNTSFSTDMNDLTIGSSLANNVTGTSIYTANLVADVWTTYSFTFVAPNNGSFITVSGTPTSNGWTDIDLFAIQQLCPTTVSFTAPADLCLDAGVQTGLGGGTPSTLLEINFTDPTNDGIFNDTDVTTSPLTVAPATAGTLGWFNGGSQRCFGNAVADYSGLPTVDGLFNVDASGTFSTPLTFVDGDVINAGTGTTGWGIISNLTTGTYNVGFRTLSDNYGYMNISYDGTDIIINRTVINPNPGEGITVGALAGSGVYSGPGVTDDGNSTTYTFDPAAAGVGVHTITYTYTDTDGCSSSASDTIEVFATTLTFTAPADLCIDAGVQTGLGGATPTGGVYAGPGVTDDGNGTTYSFDPVAAGVGVHTITYTDSNGCATPVSDTIEVFDLPTVSFTAPADLCLDAGVQTGLGGGTPSTLVEINFTDPTNDGIFNTADVTTSPLTVAPAIAGTLGWYNSGGLQCFGNAVADYSGSPTVDGLFNVDATGTFSTPLTFVDGDVINAGTGTTGWGIISNLTTGTFNVGFRTLSDNYGYMNISYDGTDIIINRAVINPISGEGITVGALAGSGVYSGPGVTDDGNGTTYTFDPTAAGVGIHTITYTFSDGNGCSNSASDTIEVFDLPTLSFTAPADLCIDAGVQTGLGGATPTGGVYAGPGVTDDGNGTTYSFDPVAAGVGVHTITYTDSNGCATPVSDTIEVFDLPTVSFTAPADLCLDAGVQTGLGGGTPSTLVEINFTDPTNDGIFNTADVTTSPLTVAPAIAGTLGWFNGGSQRCFGNAVADYSGLPTVDGLFNVDASGNFSTPLTFVDGDVINASTGTTGWGIISDLAPGTFNVGFRTLSDNYGYMNISYDGTDIIINRAVINPNSGEGITVGALAGSGVYSGPGVTDDGNGTTYTFDPTAAGVGIHTITYTFSDGNGCSNSASDTIEVFDVPTIVFTLPATICLDAGVQSGLGGATPAGGVYSGLGVTDDGNGTSFSFDPALAGLGLQTITYTVTDSNSCSNTADATVQVIECCDAQAGDLSTVDNTLFCEGIANTIDIDLNYTTSPDPSDFYYVIIVDASGIIQSFVYSGVYTTSQTISVGIPDTLATGNYSIYGSNIDTSDPDLSAIYPGGPNDLIGDTLASWESNLIGSSGPAGSGTICADLSTSFVDITVNIPVTVTFTALADLPQDAGIQTGLGGGTPVGGVYSGPGVIDDGNGLTYSFDPAVAGVGTHVITYTYNNGCILATSDDVVVDIALSTNDASLQSKLSMYPNPNQGTLYLNYTGQEPLKQLFIFDVTGKKVQTISLENFTNNQGLNLNNLAQGMYLVTIQSESASVTKRLIIE